MVPRDSGLPVSPCWLWAEADQASDKPPLFPLARDLWRNFPRWAASFGPKKGTLGKETEPVCMLSAESRSTAQYFPLWRMSRCINTGWVRILRVTFLGWFKTETNRKATIIYLYMYIFRGGKQNTHPAGFSPRLTLSRIDNFAVVRETFDAQGFMVLRKGPSGMYVADLALGEERQHC